MININNEFEVGEKVFDDLTAKETTVIGITWARGCTEGDKYCHQVDTIGYWVDNDYLGGGRHPWELTRVRCCGHCFYADEGICEFAGEISTYYVCDKFKLKEE